MRQPGRRDCQSPQSQQLLLTAALAEAPEARSAWQRWCAAFDLDSLDGEGFWILPLVYRNLLAADFDGPEKGRLAGVYKQARLNGALRLPRVLTVITDLRASGVRVLPGPLLSAVLLRPQAAIPVEPAELLVPAAGIEFTDTWLRARGWSPQPVLPAPRLRAFIPRVRYHGSDGQDLRIRWRPFGADCALAEDAGCWQRASEGQFDAGTFEVADRADLLRAADSMDSKLQAAVLRSCFGSRGDRPSLSPQEPASRSPSVLALARRHWRRYRDCPRHARPPSFAAYLYLCHAYGWQTRSLASWLAVAARKLGGRLSG